MACSVDDVLVSYFLDTVKLEKPMYMHCNLLRSLLTKEPSVWKGGLKTREMGK